MPKYEELNGTQKRLYDDLFLKIYEEGSDIEPILKEALPDDLLNVFNAVPNANGEILFTILGMVVFHIKHIPVPESKLESILKVAQNKGILKDVISINVRLILEEQHENKKTTDTTKERYTLTKLLIESHYKSILDRLEIVRKSCGLESFWKVISEDDRERIKTKLNEGKHKNILDTINEIEKSIATESNLTSKTIVASGICGAIAALAVDGGLFAAGVALPILALVGIAVAAAVLVGLVAGVITYAISKSSENLDRANVEQGVGTGERVK